MPNLDLRDMKQEQIYTKVKQLGKPTYFVA